MRIATNFIGLTIFSTLACAQIPDKCRGDWMLVNDTLILHVGADGSVGFVGSPTGHLRLQPDGSYLWDTPEAPHPHMIFSEGGLVMETMVKGFPYKLQFEALRGETVSSAQIPEYYCGYWSLVNSDWVFQVSADATMTLLNSGETGKLTLDRSGGFVWEGPKGPSIGWFTQGKLFLKSDGIGRHVRSTFAEFRRCEKEAEERMVKVALSQQDLSSPVRRAAIERALSNNLRQLSAAADQYFLENGVSTVQADRLIGPDKYIKAIRPVDGEDYHALVLRQGATLTIVSSHGITVTYQP